MRFMLMVLPLILVCGTAWSQQIALQPRDAAVELRTYGFGFFPFDGNFTRFHGWMRYSPDRANALQVVLAIEAGSLSMENETIREQIIGPGMMDVARYPELTFQGVCGADAVTGDLTMHGETHPVSLEFTRAGGTVTATGRLRRADWGITGSPLIGGSVIRIRVVLPDPFSPQHA
jgi:polyisoprenoid-binding protein YceI